jgi:hypothetical protein
VHPSEADVARPSQAHASCLARERPFDAGAARILRLKRLCSFPLPCRLESLVLRLRPDGECPPGIALLRAYTWRDLVAAPTILGRELYLNDGLLAVIDGRRPADTGLASWTSRVLLVPINLEMVSVKTGPCAGLPVIVEACGPQEIHAVVGLTLDQEFRVQKPGIDDRGPGQEAPPLQRLMNLGGRRAIGRRATCGFHVSDQVRPGILTAFREMHFVAHPLRGVLASIVGFGVVGGADARRRRWDIACFA